MRILTFSDLHRNEKVYEAIRSLLIHRRYDLILIGGDTTEYDDVDFLEDVVELASRTPTYVIPGNMEGPEAIEFMNESGKSVDGRVIDLPGNYQLVGIGGAPKGPFGTPNEFTDDQLCEKLDSLSPDPDKPLIMLSHSPPKGYFDEVSRGLHIGSECILKLMKKWKPCLLICGHVHEFEGHTTVGNTEIVKLPPAKAGRVMEITLNHGKVVKVDVIDFFE